MNEFTLYRKERSGGWNRCCEDHGRDDVRIRYSYLVRKPEGKRSLRRPRRRWETNIKTHLE
jgi:hypothetical protein